MQNVLFHYPPFKTTSGSPASYILGFLLPFPAFPQNSYLFLLFGSWRPIFFCDFVLKICNFLVDFEDFRKFSFNFKKMSFFDWWNTFGNSTFKVSRSYGKFRQNLWIANILWNFNSKILGWDEVLWSKDIADSLAGENIGKKSTIWDKKHRSSFLSLHSNQVFKPLHFIQEIFLPNKRNKCFRRKLGFLVILWTLWPLIAAFKILTFSYFLVKNSYLFPTFWPLLQLDTLQHIWGGSGLTGEDFFCSACTNLVAKMRAFRLHSLLLVDGPMPDCSAKPQWSYQNCKFMETICNSH